MRIIAIILIMFTASVTAFAETTKIWPSEEKGIISKKFGPDIRTVRSPNDFIVTPMEISEMCSLRKYAIVIYADDTYYYIAKYGASIKDAEAYGTKINGKTGEIIYPAKRNKYSIIGDLKEYKRL